MPVFDNDAALRQVAASNQTFTDEQGRTFSIDDFGKVQYYNKSGQPISQTEATLPAYKQSGIWRKAEDLLTLGGRLDVSLQNKSGDAPYPILEMLTDAAVEGLSLGLINPDPRGVGRGTLNAMSKVWSAVGLDNFADYEKLNRSVGRSMWLMPALAFGTGGAPAITSAAQGLGVRGAAAGVLGSAGAAIGREAFTQLGATGQLDLARTGFAGISAAVGQASATPSVKDFAKTAASSVGSALGGRKRALSLPVESNKRSRQTDVSNLGIAEYPASRGLPNSDEDIAKYFNDVSDVADDGSYSSEPSPKAPMVLDQGLQNIREASTVLMPSVAVQADPEGRIGVNVVSDVANSTQTVSILPSESKLEAVLPVARMLQESVYSFEPPRSYNANGQATFNQATSRVELRAENEISQSDLTLPRTSTRQAVDMSKTQNAIVDLLPGHPMYRSPFKALDAIFQSQQPTKPKMNASDIVRPEQQIHQSDRWDRGINLIDPAIRGTFYESPEEETTSSKSTRRTRRRPRTKK